MVRNLRLTLRPGVKPFLEVLNRAGVRRAIASSTHLLNIETALHLLGLEKYFHAVLTAEDVTRGKPHPEPFLLAAQRLGAEPSRCIVFEDAHVGVAAARAAGMKVVVVTTTHPAATLGDADLVLTRLDEVPLTQIANLVATNKSFSL